MGKVLVFAVLAAWNPLLLAIVPVMLVSARPKRLMLGYLVGGYTVSITLGLVFVLAAGGSSAASTTTRSVNPAVNLTLGAVALLSALGLAVGRDKRLRRRSREKAAKDKGPPRWRRALDTGSVPLACAVGAAFTRPAAATSPRYRESINSAWRWAGRSRLSLSST